MGIDFVHFGLESGMVFEGTTGMYDIHVVFIVSIPNDTRCTSALTRPSFSL